MSDLAFTLFVVLKARDKASTDQQWVDGNDHVKSIAERLIGSAC